MHNPCPPLLVAFARFDADADAAVDVVRENIVVVDAVFDFGIVAVAELALDTDVDIDAAWMLTLCLVHCSMRHFVDIAPSLLVRVTYSCHVAHCTSHSPGLVAARHFDSAHGLNVAQ